MGFIACPLVYFYEWTIMTKYLLNRILRGIISIIVVIGIVMLLVYNLMDRNQIFSGDSVYSHKSNNQKTTYKYQKWEEYGYLDYVPYTDWLSQLVDEGTIDFETRESVAAFGRKPENDSKEVAEYVAKFTDYYESQGYTVVRMNAVTQGKNKIQTGGQQQLFAYRDVPIAKRMLSYFGSLFVIDNIHFVKEDIGKRGLQFTLHDPVYGGKFAPAIMANGTKHKYLLYVDSKFPFVHQNLFTINLGKSYSVNQGIDAFTTMTQSQGSFVKKNITYPSGVVEYSADDLHSATYTAGSLEVSKTMYSTSYFVDDYTNVNTYKNNMSKMGFSFVIGIISSFIAFFVGIPLGILMARKKDQFWDKLGTVYIIFVIAVPSLALIFMVKGLGGSIGLPTTFLMDQGSVAMYILPIVALSLAAIGMRMKWMRRFMIDQVNSDYVKFARSGGLTEREIFSKHIMKNAIIPIVHGIPGAILGAMTGAFYTEKVFVVPGMGNLMIKAIGVYDNGVIVGVALFYAVISVLSMILGDVLMAVVDPRISFSTKAR